jgi:hypothetical protein
MLGSILGAPSPASFFFSPGKLAQNYTHFFFKNKIRLQILENFTKFDQTPKNLKKFH